MPTPSAQLGLPQIAGSDSPDIPRDINAVIARFEAIRNTYATMQVGDVGDVGQIRAGRPLTVADFTGIGLNPPQLLANLSVLAGAGSNLGSGGNLTNKGAVVNAPGILGAAGEAAQFAGAAGQFLYSADIGAADPFRVRTLSIGCWFRTGKRGTEQNLISKWGVAGQQAYILGVSTANQLQLSLSSTGSDSIAFSGQSDVADDRWHFGVATFDASRPRVYVDAGIESFAQWNTYLAAVPGPLNISGRAGDAGTNVAAPHWGRTQVAFVTSDVLSDDQVRYLYCASLAHTLPVSPKQAWLGVRRRKRGGPLATTDFSTTPSRLYNFTAGAVANEGSDANGAAGTTATLLPNPGTGFILDVASPDGASGAAKWFSGAHTGLSATDAGLPAGTAARSHGLWLKTLSLNAGILSWGTPTAPDLMLSIATTGILQSWSGADGISGPYVADGLWHQATVVEDNAAADGVKRKLYLDARLVGGSTVMNAITLAGANRFRVGAKSDGTLPFTGVAARAFVYSGALTADQVRAVYNKGSQALSVSQKEAGAHTEAFEPVRALVVFDSLEACDQIDLALTA